MHNCRKKPIHASVNCWFCNQNTVVPYGNRNCWDCPNCDQYNGFQEVSLKPMCFWLFLSFSDLSTATEFSCSLLWTVFSFIYWKFCWLLLFQNGDYNKPIPAQYLEHLNHGVSGGVPASETPKTLQWVNCQMLLCKKCNNNQTVKIKQLASFIPRDDVCILFPSSFIPLQFHPKIISSSNDFLEHWLIHRRTTMRKLKPISTTWSRCTSCAGRARQLWSTTLNIRTDNFALFSSTISFDAAGNRTKAL